MTGDREEQQDATTVLKDMDRKMGLDSKASTSSHERRAFFAVYDGGGGARSLHAPAFNLARALMKCFQPT